MKANIKVIGLIIIVSVLVFANSLKNDFVFDDVSFVSENISLRNTDNIPKLFTKEYFDISKERTYRPVCTLSFMLDYMLWKFDVRGWHLTSIVLHTLNAILVYLIALLILKNGKMAVIAGLLFAVHPV